MYHRISPKRGPTQAAVTTSVAPKTDPTTPLTPTAAASTPQLPTASDILHTDDYDLIVVGNASAAPDVAHAGRKTKGSGAAREEVEEEEEEEEEGSSADPQPDTGSNYTPGYDYIVDDSDSRNERVVDVVTSMTTAPLRTTTQSHTIRPLFTTKVPLRSTTPRGVYWTPRATSKAKITTPSVKPVRQWTPKPRITPLLKTTSKPQSKSKSKSADIPRTTGAPAHTVKVLKYQKTSVAHKTTSKSPEAKKLKHRPGSPVSTTSAYGNLNARDHIGMDVFWVVGNWSEVGGSALHACKDDGCRLRRGRSTEQSASCPLRTGTQWTAPVVGGDLLYTIYPHILTSIFMHFSVLCPLVLNEWPDLREP